MSVRRTWSVGFKKPGNILLVTLPGFFLSSLQLWSQLVPASQQVDLEPQQQPANN